MNISQIRAIGFHSVSAPMTVICTRKDCRVSRKRRDLRPASRGGGRAPTPIELFELVGFAAMRPEPNRSPKNATLAITGVLSPLVLVLLIQWVAGPYQSDAQVIPDVLDRAVRCNPSLQVKIDAALAVIEDLESA